ncbi:retrotransposon protein, putative, ty1-copia subclass, partial [Tanacetum coccineum]
MFQAKASKERLDAVKSLMACKPKPGASICAFVLEMKWYFDRLESLNMVFDAEKGKFNRGSKRKAESEIAPTSDPKEAVCFYYNTKGHWKRSCPKYLKDLKDEKVKKGSHSGSKGKYE